MSLLIQNSASEARTESAAAINFTREANANSILNIHTVCDSCSARSTNVVFPEGSNEVGLTFCGHHTRKNAEKLIGNGFSIFPENYSFVEVSS